eukprot:TRINITY_DN2747_c0_g1_i1.p1 TRINITY_DN2747_c0_g1~~TRINITY_DN2747_c0_g1_i1.p1  ORF type:complete len:128 (+),score=40.38 TRINITY_DN2747_c0_g1_i1:69-452(+)
MKRAAERPASSDAVIAAATPATADTSAEATATATATGRRALPPPRQQARPTSMERALVVPWVAIYVGRAVGDAVCALVTMAGVCAQLRVACTTPAYVAAMREAYGLCTPTSPRVRACGGRRRGFGWR